MDTIFGQFDKEKKKLQLNNSRYSYYENDAFICSVYGDVWLENRCNDYPLILDAYQQYGDDIVNKIAWFSSFCIKQNAVFLHLL